MISGKMYGETVYDISDLDYLLRHYVISLIDYLSALDYLNRFNRLSVRCIYDFCVIVGLTL